MVRVEDFWSCINVKIWRFFGDDDGAAAEARLLVLYVVVRVVLVVDI